MIYIIVALKAEAQAFIDKNMQVIVSGMGIKNMFETTNKIVKQMHKDDIVLNVGICGASKKYEIGQLIDGFKEELTCVKDAIYDKTKYNLVDMESEGFIQATLHVEKKYMYKVVSDYFEPETITKDGAKKLIFDNIDEIMEKIKL